MIAHATTMRLAALCVPRNPTDYSRLADSLCEEAADQLAFALEGASGKQLERASVPGCGRHGVSRALNGDPSNPLFRIAALFLVMKRMGMGRERALRLLAWLGSVVDAVWPPEEEPGFDEVVERDADLDVRDDAERVRSLHGDPVSLGRYLEAKIEQAAYAPVVIAGLRRKLAQG